MGIIKVDLLDDTFIHTAKKLILDNIEGMLRSNETLTTMIKESITAFLISHEGFIKDIVKDVLTHDKFFFNSHIYRGTYGAPKLTGYKSEDATVPLDIDNVIWEIKKIIETEVVKILKEKIKFTIESNTEVKSDVNC